MQFSLDVPSQGFHLTRYTNNSVEINDISYHQHLILTLEKILDWPIKKVTDITLASLTPALAGNPQVLLIGTGIKHVLLPPALSVSLMQQGVGVEVMSTPAACRTYTILTAESRLVSAALILGSVDNSTLSL